MSSAICQNFVQNAWKKELCSNCFKSIDEHREKPKPKPLNLVSNDKVSGIIKGTKKAKTKHSVCFVKDLTEIIGYGGEDWSSDNEESSGGSNESSEEETDDESAKELQRITKENTDYNTVSLKESDNKKNNYAPLLLGKPVVDSSGKKQTLLVSVTPFGEDSSSHQVKKLNTKNFQISTSNKVILPETETNVVLTSYTKNEQIQSHVREEKSLLDEITETLENGRNPIQIIQKKTVEEKSEKKSTNLTRTPALKRDIEKPVIHQSSSISKADASNNKPAKSSPKLEPIQTTKNFIDAEIQHAKSDFFPKEKFLKDKYIPFSQSRDLAGKPDGREDPVTNETPPLPKTPPPPVLDAQSSFLHGAQPVPLYEKPKIPSKPVVMKKNPVQIKAASKPIEDPNESDPKCNKRKAPSPPEEISLSSNRSTPRNSTEEEAIYVSAEHLSRKSLSTDCLTINDKRKDKNKARFSLKKFLKMGSHKDLTKTQQIEHEDPSHKPKLIIVHPCELNGTKVEVVSKQLIDDNQHEYSVPNECFQSQKAAKPPPPPRNHPEYNKPVLPTPPKSVDIINKQKQLSRNNSASKQQETVYANIGEVRSSIVPNKPVRTASMREREAALQLQLQQKQTVRKHPHNYEPLHNNNNNNKDPNENVYDYINSTRSSSPDSDPGADKAKNARLAKRSESSQDVAGEYFKYGPIPRSVSLTYCGSETESEIYSPYGFYGSESEVTEDDHDWIQHGRTHKLRSRKGRSIVHKNLEDNYGAVVVANYEALAQVLENIQQINHIQPALRGLKTVSNLRWTDFSVKSSTGPVQVGSRVFHQAMWGTHNVTVAVSAGSTVSNAMPSASYTLTPIIEFSDLIPNAYLATNDNEDDNNKQTLATAWVFPYLQINTIQSYGELLKTKSDEECWRDSNFTMLQLVNALKSLQAQGIEELPLSLSSFVLCKDMDKETHHRLCVFQGMTLDVASKSQQEKQGTLCTCAARALACLQPSPRIVSLLQSLLNHERAVSLTQVKSVLEFSLWGPSDVSLGATIKERELALQRWLDLQRATVLHGLVCARIQLTVYEEFHLLFLVRSSARMMCDASLLIESSNLKHSVGFGQSRAEKCVGAC
ncbi:unnamed protein product [Phyllotreta striolata]|uniref:Uncharacterized protein n=1 Tax=Phyllotreta striolata TaxID=444603 RepID=A0A9N9TKN8_PHYSR|nr:unnamed protein product [Phyllotreta striolata]